MLQWGDFREEQPWEGDEEEEENKKGEEKVSVWEVVAWGRRNWAVGPRPLLKSLCFFFSLFFSIVLHQDYHNNIPQIHIHSKASSLGHS